MFENQFYDFLLTLFERLPTQTRAGIIGGMMSPAVMLVWIIYESLGEQAKTGTSLLLVFSILWVFVGALVGAIGGTIIGTFAIVMKKRLTKDSDLPTHQPSTSLPKLWHHVPSSGYKTSRKNAWTWVKENAIMICGFIGGLLSSATLPLWLFSLN